MLQRKQSLFLLIALMAVVGSMLLPLWAAQAGDIKTTLTAFSLDSVHISNAQPDKNLSFGYLGGIQVVSALLLVITTFRYRNRPSQMKLILGVVGLQVAVLGLAFGMEIPKAIELANAGESGGYGIGIFLPVLAAVLSFAARIFIKKDEELVRSVDRIR